MDLTRTPQEVQEDWEKILQRPGMTVLYLWVKKQIKHSQAGLEAASTDTYDKVCKCRGNLEAMKGLALFLDRETKRAIGDNHTPDGTEEK